MRFQVAVSEEEVGRFDGRFARQAASNIVMGGWLTLSNHRINHRHGAPSASGLQSIDPRGLPTALQPLDDRPRRPGTVRATEAEDTCPTGWERIDGRPLQMRHLDRKSDTSGTVPCWFHRPPVSGQTPCP
jgi:hypothetical protein